MSFSQVQPCIPVSTPRGLNDFLIWKPLPFPRWHSWDLFLVPRYGVVVSLSPSILQSPLLSQTFHGLALKVLMFILQRVRRTRILIRRNSFHAVRWLTGRLFHIRVFRIEFYDFLKNSSSHLGVNKTEWKLLNRTTFSTLFIQTYSCFVKYHFQIMLYNFDFGRFTKLNLLILLKFSIKFLTARYSQVLNLLQLSYIWLNVLLFNGLAGSRAHAATAADFWW